MFCEDILVVGPNCSNHKTTCSIGNEPPSWSDTDDSLVLMSGPERDEHDMPDDKDLTRSGVVREDNGDEGQ